MNGNMGFVCTIQRVNVLPKQRCETAMVRETDASSCDRGSIDYPPVFFVHLAENCEA